MIIVPADLLYLLVLTNDKKASNVEARLDIKSFKVVNDSFVSAEMSVLFKNTSIWLLDSLTWIKADSTPDLDSKENYKIKTKSN